MEQKRKKLKFLAGVLVSVFLFLELASRFYGVEFRIFASDLGRKNIVRARQQSFIAAAREMGVSDKTFNIYFLGESTMWGVPFGPEMSIPNLVDYRLGGSLGGRSVKAINFSSAAKDAVYASYIADFILRRKDIFHPSLIVMYSGHNQFLKFHPADPDLHFPGVNWLADHSAFARLLLILISRSTGQIFELDRRSFFDHPAFPFDRRGYDKVINNYKKQILKLVGAAEKSHVPLVISALVCNYVDWEPNRSVFCSSNREQKRQFREMFERGLEAEHAKNYTGALKLYQDALSMCGSFAEVYFREGKVYEALGDHDKAWDAYQNANDYDAFPSYAVSAQNDFILSLDRFDSVYVVDSLSYLRKNSPDTLLGEQLIIDGIHPNLEGYLLLSEAVAEKIHSLFALEGESLRGLDAQTARNVFHLTEPKMFDVYYQTGRWVTRLATWRYNPADRLEIAEHFFNKAIEINPARHEGYLGLGVTALLRKDREQAEFFLHKAQAIDAESTNMYLQNPWIRKIIRRAGFGELIGAS